MSSSLTTGSSSAAGTAEAPAWKHYPFFDVVEVKDAHDLESSPDIFKAALEISTVASSSVGMLVADIHGSVHVLNRDFESLISWIAHSGGRVTHMAERKGILVTLGEEDMVRSPLLKIWDLGSKDKKTGGPVLLRSAKAQHNNKPHPVTSIALSSNLSYLAVGMGDGTVMLYRHLDQALTTGLAGALTSIPKPKVIHDSVSEPITGLGFKEPSEDDSAPGISLFITTIARVLVYQVTGKSGGLGSGSSAEVVDEIGCGLGCANMDWGKQNIVVAKDEAVYYVGMDGRGPCYAYEGTKSSLHTHANYLIIVSPPFVPSAADASATVRNFVARTPNRPAESDITKISVFEPENKYVAYSGTFTQDVREVVSQWGNIYILTSDGNMLCLKEKTTATKLDFLYRKSLYNIALSLAKTQKLDASVVGDIHKQYGDHLYAKGEYDQAMQQYIQTIGHLQPSYVIRKFLSSQRINNLVNYLQELHSLGLANADHTTLLLNTYTKLKDVSRLDSFIKTESKRTVTGGEGTKALPFDLDTAIRVCRQAGYFEHASYLAKKYDKHEDYLRIQIEDSGNYKDALGYLRRLGPASAESNLARYGRAMLENLPQETTQLLIDLCTTSTLNVEEGTAAAALQKQGLPILSYLAINHGPVVLPAVTTDNALPGGGTQPAPAQPDSESPSQAAPTHRPGTPPSGLPAPSSNSLPPLPPPVKRLSPRVYFAHFVDHREQFVTFLETVALRRWGQSVDAKANGIHAKPEQPLDEGLDHADQVAVWNTLLELYLTSSQQAQQDKALRLLQSSTLPYDPMHALILCSTRNYTAGLVLLWEKMEMYEDVLRFWMDKEKESRDDPDVAKDASSQVIQHLDKYGLEHPHLYTLVLRFLTSTSELLGRHREDVKRYLQIVDEEEIIPPLGIVQLLSRNDVASVGLVKDWLIERVKITRSEIQKDQQLTTSYRLETASKLKQVEALSDPEHPNVFHVTRCSSCGGQLDLPSYHFMCDHSYHQRCLPENNECPKCAREYSVIREIRRTNERLADQHDVFLEEVRESGFEAIAAGFGRGLLSVMKPHIQGTSA